MNQPSQRPWFKSRRYGWGWMPATWHGWLMIFVYLVVIIVAATSLLAGNKSSPNAFVAGVAFVLIFLSATFLLVGISLLKGEELGSKKGKK